LDVPDEIRNRRGRRKVFKGPTLVHVPAMGILPRVTITTLRRHVWKAIAAAILCLTAAPWAGALAQTRASTEDWIQLFNGRDLEGWTMKFSKHDLC
jgi:hypothetical protein